MASLSKVGPLLSNQGTPPQGNAPRTPHRNKYSPLSFSSSLVKKTAVAVFCLFFVVPIFQTAEADQRRLAVSSRRNDSCPATKLVDGLFTSHPSSLSIEEHNQEIGSLGLMLTLHALHDHLEAVQKIIKRELHNSLCGANLMIAKLVRAFANRHNLLGLRRFAKTRIQRSEREFAPKWSYAIPSKV